MIRSAFCATGIRTGLRGMAGVVVGLLLAALWVAGATPAQAAPSVTVDPTTGVEDGTTVNVSGSGFDTSKGIYIAYCVVPAGGGLPTPCGGGVDMSGSTGASVWISNDPPPYGRDLARPFDDGGSFQTSVTVSSTIGSYDCREVTCAIVTRADHLRPSDRSQDTAVVISFAEATPPPPPEPEPTPPPETPAPDPEPPVEEQPEPTEPPEQTTPEPEPDPDDVDGQEDDAAEDEAVDDSERVPPPPGAGPPLPPVPNADHSAAMVRANEARLAETEPEPSPPVADAPEARDAASGPGAVAMIAGVVGVLALLLVAVLLVRRRRRGARTHGTPAGNDTHEHTPTPTSPGHP